MRKKTGCPYSGKTVFGRAGNQQTPAKGGCRINPESRVLQIRHSAGKFQPCLSPKILAIPFAVFFGMTSGKAWSDLGGRNE
jgi:hypothetical protein